MHLRGVSKFFKAQNKKHVSQLHWGLTFCVFGLCILSLFILYSAAGGSFHPWASRQLFHIILGTAVFFATSFMEQRILVRFSFPVYIFFCFLLLVVYFFGSYHMGARRWIDLGFFQFQPSEGIKYFTIMALAAYFHRVLEKNLMTYIHVIVGGLIIAFPAFLVERQPDLGTALVIILTGFTLLWLVGVYLFFFLGGLALLTASMPFLWSLLKPYQQERLLVFLHLTTDPSGAGYNIMQAKIALGSAGFLGKGYLSGTQSHLSFLPAKHTDFIFSMFGEEFGFAGNLLLFVVFSLTLIYSYSIARAAQSYFGQILAVGLATNYFLHIFINISMTVGIAPVVGIPLPPLSYGGTSLVFWMFSMGLLMNVSIHRSTHVSKASVFG